MQPRPIITYPDPVLKARASEIRSIDALVVTLAEDMRETMYLAPGVGLAAPQVGVSSRLIVVDPTAGKEPGRLIVMLNPIIVESEGSLTDSEMCLSVPEVSVNVKRAQRILVRGMDLKGREVSVEAEGYLARIFQHEIDHLDGKVILDYASSLKRALYLKKKKKGLV
ncbi:MAG TPA: peptide deformylase [Deltaproteobacteria bacterium]|nr:peptide deformylase [Deltaproteobacteria bacterium]HOM28045.1 peptide deformylase [Deltaproteobacteria bacterium]HPP80384.1 peptide deformylase [Deltaproteobacteria bacterium]